MIYCLRTVASAHCGKVGWIRVLVFLMNFYWYVWQLAILSIFQSDWMDSLVSRLLTFFRAGKHHKSCFLFESRYNLASCASIWKKSTIRLISEDSLKWLHLTQVSMDLLFRLWGLYIKTSRKSAWLSSAGISCFSMQKWFQCVGERLSYCWNSGNFLKGWVRL